MRLNADILFDNLSQFVRVEYYGHGKTERTLRRPELSDGANREFKPDQIYIALADRLPADPVFGDGVVMICVGSKPSIAYLVGKCVCFFIRDGTDLFTVFNLVQQIFNKYDDWDSGLRDILDGTASVKEMIELSFPIIENPIVVIDSDFHYLAYSDVIDERAELYIYRPDENGNLKQNTVSQSISYESTYMANTKPIQMTIEGIDYLIFNLYEKSVYAGNMTISYNLRRMRASDMAQAQHLVQAIEGSFKKHSKILSGRLNILNRIFQDLLNGFQMDSTKRQQLEGGHFDGQYLCVNMRMGYRAHSKVPVGYFCNIIEGSFAGAVAFEYESSIIAFINLKKIHCTESRLIDNIKVLLVEMNLKAGISHPFTNLSMARLYYRQACAAFEMGSAISPDISCYLFDDYVLFYMMSHCMGEFPMELLFPKGIDRLVEHDQISHASYVHTLRTYLNNNMNITKTAKDLFLHRSTLLERLKRIENMLQADLSDADQRLRLLIILKLIEHSENTAMKQNGMPSMGEECR